MSWLRRKAIEWPEKAGPFDISLGELIEARNREFYETRTQDQLNCLAFLHLCPQDGYITDDVKALQAELKRRSGDTAEERKRCQDIAWDKLKAQKAALKEPGAHG